MDDFNDFYNRFVASTYGSNVLGYLFFLTAFFVIVLWAIVIVLIRLGRTKTPPPLQHGGHHDAKH